MRFYLYLTIGGDGKGKLTKNKPIWKRIEGTRRYAPYPKPGEPVEMGGLCKEWLEKLLGELPEPGKSIRLQIDVEKTGTN